MTAIQQSLEALDPAAMTAAGVMLAGANRVVTVGNDASGFMARRLAGMLARRNCRARAEVSPADATWANDLDPGDVVVVISHRGQAVSPTAGILPAFPTIRARGARLLAVTNAPDSPVGRAADVVVATHLAGRYQRRRLSLWSPSSPCRLSSSGRWSRQRWLYVEAEQANSRGLR